MNDVDLRHHGDKDVAPGLVDLAVNVRLKAPPQWLAEVIRASLADLGTYPDPSAATAAIALRHGVPEECVLPTNGAAEAFTLMARARPWAAPLVVHPQFTEPEAALVAARRLPRRHLLSAASGYRLDPTTVHPRADLVVIGNPTNPTGTLHTRAELRELRRPGRVVVVDEAFMDAVPEEAETLTGGNLHGMLVVRSLTKTWGLAGLRAGYVIGDAHVISDLRDVQSPWSVSAPALAAMVACMSPRALAEGRAVAAHLRRNRDALVEALGRTQAVVVGEPQAPFVLVDTSAISPQSLREPLAAKGFAVRRGETFPGLGPTWLRLAAREPAVSQALANAILDIERSSRAA